MSSKALDTKIEQVSAPILNSIIGGSMNRRIKEHYGLAVKVFVRVRKVKPSVDI